MFSCFLWTANVGRRTGFLIRLRLSWTRVQLKGMSPAGFRRFPEFLSPSARINVPHPRCFRVDFATSFRIPDGSTKNLPTCCFTPRMSTTYQKRWAQHDPRSIQTPFQATQSDPRSQNSIPKFLRALLISRKPRTDLEIE